MERQEVVLGEAVPDWSSVTVFRDHLDRKDRRMRKSDGLFGRQALVLPEDRADPLTIYVASIAVLAIDEPDLRVVLGGIFASGGTVVAVQDERQTFARHHSMPEMIEAWRRSRRKWRIAQAQIVGSRASADKKKTLAAEGVERIRRYWHLPSDEWPTLKLREMAGVPGQPLSYNTIVAHLGVGRETAQLWYKNALKSERDRVTEETKRAVRRI